MPELTEVFEMTTKQIEPDVDAWREQEKHQRRSSRTRRIGAFAVAAAISVVAVIVVIRAGDEATGTSPSPVSQPTGRSEIPRLPWGALEPGRYAISITSYPSMDYSPLITIDVPRGYEGFEGFAVFELGRSWTGVSASAIGEVYADACRWRGTLLDRSAISSTDDVVAAIATQEGLRVSKPTDVTVDGFAGSYMERRVPAGVEPFACDEGQHRAWLDTGGGAYWLGDPGQLDLLWILDVEGAPIAIAASLDPGASAQDRAELVQMVESIDIDPR